MTEDQADRMIELLQKIVDKLDTMSDTSWSGDSILERMEDKLETMSDKLAEIANNTENS